MTAVESGAMGKRSPIYPLKGLIMAVTSVDGADRSSKRAEHSDGVLTLIKFRDRLEPAKVALDS
ncbi:hypothetical protein AWC16_17775 [Mycolicibacter longobardus]|uniref:Uncharacterized protein n=1 Tax=Mycolicibacter longobardus TaxID=1108812 RepID=A0A1X1YDW9_9MYCO|nr:hypothetical protein AWC16_17775 [Mycolicibacter longobardus]